MLRITQSNSAEGAVKYFDEGLTKADYYQGKDHTIGLWGGKAAKLLGLDHEVTRADFAHLAFNKHPLTGEQLTPRNDANRRVGYDLTFSVPKSVSIVYGLTGDKDIVEAFHKATSTTMTELEKEAETRVRLDGKNENRVTGNLVWANFTHEESRPVNGIPDCHLHTHVFCFNMTHDSVEQRWKAADIAEIKTWAPYYEAMFHSHLANELKKAGYGIERNERDFEITGFKRPLIEKFSRRTVELEMKALELGLTNAQSKSELAARNRESKRTGYSTQDIRMQWRSRLTDREIELVYGAKNSGNAGNSIDKEKSYVQAKVAIKRSLSHNLERKSVTSMKEVLRDALKFSIGEASFMELKKAFETTADILKGKDRYGKAAISTKEALHEEKRLVEFARRNSSGDLRAISPDHVIGNKELSGEQVGAVKHFLSSKELISVIAGGAGTGKTWTVSEIKKAVIDQGMSFNAFAPSSEASRQVQREAGFENATTVADLLKNKKHQENLKDGVIWIDEAGLMGNKTMNEVLGIAQAQNARVLLTGDIKQHNAVERGDALRIMQEFGGIKPNFLREIRRQKVGEYREVVSQIAGGSIVSAFGKLEQMDAIKEHEGFVNVANAVAAEYVESVSRNQDALVISTTHNQGKAITGLIREKLKEINKLDKEERVFPIQENLSYTNAQKQDAAFYSAGMQIQFHQNAKGGVLRGEKMKVVDVKDSEVLVKRNNGTTLNLDLGLFEKFSVYQTGKMPLAIGDRIRITQNGFAQMGKRIDNGCILEIAGFTHEGNIVANSGKRTIVLDRHFENFTHGYYTTSPGSQGKSVNKVIIAQDSSSGLAASKEQFYVSVSRGKFEVSIHTDDKDHLKRSILRSSERMSAAELVRNSNKVIDGTRQRVERIRNLYETTRKSILNISGLFDSKTVIRPNIKQHIIGGKGK